MSREAQNKAVVGRWFTEFWGKQPNSIRAAAPMGDA